MKVSRTVSYALQATVQLAMADDECPVPCSQLAAAGCMPERFLLQVLRSLVAHGVLKSTRGVDGGYALSRSADEVSLLDVMEAIEGPLVSSLPAAEGLPEQSRARVLQALAHVTESMRRELAAVKLSRLLPDPAQPNAADGEPGRAQT